MEQSPCCESTRHSAIHEIVLLLWYPKVHDSLHNSPLLVPVLGQMNPVSVFCCLGRYKESVQFEAPCNILYHADLYGAKLLAPVQPGRPPEVDCPRLFIKYIHTFLPSFLPYLMDVSFIHNPKTRHGVVAGSLHCVEKTFISCTVRQILLRWSNQVWLGGRDL
jgi:hypothetical protein